MTELRELDDRPLFIEGIAYNIELSTCSLHEKVVYLGTKSLNGKKVLVFETQRGKQLEVNPSFHTFTLEIDEDFGSAQQSTKGDVQ